MHKERRQTLPHSHSIDTLLTLSHTHSLTHTFTRFLEMHFTYMGSTGTAKGSSSSSSTSTSSAADGPGGLDLSPVYVPAFTFSWWHGGAKVCARLGGLMRQ